VKYTPHVASSILIASVQSVLRLFCAAIFAGALFVQAQTLTVLHSFAGGADGAYPYAGLTQDAAGNLYGTTYVGGTSQCPNFADGCGVVFKLSHRGSGWITNLLYTFRGQPDGQYPMARVIVGPDGALYGTTTQGGTGSCQNLYGCGTVFKLQPPPSFCAGFSCPWRETILYSFSSRQDGYNPLAELVFDRAGNIYGTTANGGGGANCNNDGCGTVFKLTPNSNGTWTKTTVYAFQGGTNDGAYPDAGVVIDQNGNLYGTTGAGGGSGNCYSGGCGTAFELTPGSSGWTETLLHRFANSEDGVNPEQLTFDSNGNLWGYTPYGGPIMGGAIFKLIPVQGGGAAFSVQYTFVDGQGVSNPLTLDANGNIYASAEGGLNSPQQVYSLTQSGGGWNFSSLYMFTGDYYLPVGAIVRDGAGTIYGATIDGGSYGKGLIYELTP